MLYVFFVIHHASRQVVHVPRQLLWWHIRSSGAQYWYCPGSHTIQVASSQRHSRALGQIRQN
jgi:hypothetical protein